MVSLLVSVLYPLVILYVKVPQDVQPVFPCNSFHFCLCNSPHFCLLSFHFYLWIWASGNLGAHPETRGNLTVAFPLMVFRFQPLTICRKLHFRCLTGFWIYFCFCRIFLLFLICSIQTRVNYAQNWCTYVEGGLYQPLQIAGSNPTKQISGSSDLQK